MNTDCLVGPPRCEPLLGQVALERLDLIVDSSDGVRYVASTALPIYMYSFVDTWPEPCSSGRYTDGINIYSWNYCNGPGSRDFTSKYGSAYGDGTP